MSSTNKKNKNKFAGIFLLGIVLFVGAVVFLKTYIKTYTQTKIFMGTFVKIDICARLEDKEKVERAFVRAWARMKDISRKMNVYDQSSEVYQLNHSYGKIIQVSKETYNVILSSKYFNKISEGVFNIAIFPLIELWKKSQETNTLPANYEIASALGGLDNESIKLLADNKILLTNKSMQMDLSSIAKGFAVDETAKVLKDFGFNRFFIDAGGDIYVSGHNGRNKEWRIGIRNPRDPLSLFNVLHLKDIAITTSGDYENYFKVLGKQYSHIINPITGYPQKGIISATVIAPDAKTADALSTTLCLLSPEKGTRLIDSLGKNFASLVVWEDDQSRLKFYESNHFKKYLIK